MGQVFRGVFDNQQLLIFQQVAAGKTGRQTASALNLDVAEVNRVVRRTCRQLGAANRRDAAAIIARHQGWDMVPSVLPRQRTYQNGCDRIILTTGTAPTGRDRPGLNSYVADVGGRHPLQESDQSTLNDIMNFGIIGRKAGANITLQRLALATAVVTSGAIALCSLVAAMQGFHVIMGS